MRVPDKAKKVDLPKPKKVLVNPIELAKTLVQEAVVAQVVK